MDLKRGQIVIAKAGREKGKKLVILEANNQYCMLCDGKERPLERPKRKNRKHIALTRMVLAPQEIATNRAVRAALRKHGMTHESD